MIKDAAPNNQNLFKQTYKLICWIATVFFIVLIYARYRSFLSIEWAAEGVFLLLLASVLWLYRVDNCWKFQIDGDEVYIRLSYNFFLRGVIIIVAREERKRFPFWYQKGVQYSFCISERYYIVEMNKSEIGSFFICSIQQKKGGKKPGHP